MQTCAEEGGEWLETQQCGGQCRDGACQGEVVCVEGEVRCNGQNRCSVARVVLPGSYESCVEQCTGGSCVGAACLPVELAATPTQLSCGRHRLEFDLQWPHPE